MFKWLQNLFGFGTVVNVVNEVFPDEVQESVDSKPVKAQKSVKITKASLSKLTKQGLEDLAKANYGFDIDKRKKKADLVSEVLKLSKNAK